VAIYSSIALVDELSNCPKTNTYVCTQYKYLPQANAKVPKIKRCISWLLEQLFAFLVQTSSGRDRLWKLKDSN
jgi:hypothetical protein